MRKVGEIPKFVFYRFVRIDREPKESVQNLKGLQTMSTTPGRNSSASL